jgi:hypothetical protein
MPLVPDRTIIQIDPVVVRFAAPHMGVASRPDGLFVRATEGEIGLGIAISEDREDCVVQMSRITRDGNTMVVWFVPWIKLDIEGPALGGVLPTVVDAPPEHHHGS